MSEHSEEAFLEQTRGQLAKLITSLALNGLGPLARALSEAAVSQKLWEDAHQRPQLYFPYLPPVPVHDPGVFPVIGYLERHFPAIRQELDRVTQPKERGFRPVAEPLVDRGKWDEILFYEAGERFEQSARWFPQTSRILDGLPEEARTSGVVSLSWIYPGTHVIPHCGYTNGRLRIHLGIKIPTGVSLRVKDRHLTWKEGKCLVFDDSYEHEVWHAGKGQRVILLLDILHPGLLPEDRARLVSKRKSMETQIQTFMSENRIKSILREEGGDKISFLPEEYLQKVILRKMIYGNIRSATLEEGILRVNDAIEP